MPILLMRHKVTDYETWRQVFEEEAWTRQANGSLDELCFRSADDPNEIWVFLRWDDLFRARLFVRSEDLGNALARAGVIDQSEYWYLDDIDPS